MYEVEYVPGEPLATTRRLFGDRFRQDMIAWLESSGHVGASETTMADGIAIATRQAIEEVAEDIKAGVVPANVTSFAQLHDYVDANGYGGAFDWPEGEPMEESDEGYVLDTCAFWNAVQDGVEGAMKQESRTQ